jgi:hypothetical protein
MSDLMHHDDGPCGSAGRSPEIAVRIMSPLADTTTLGVTWVCDDHLVIEAQAWDTHGWDGVDFRCHAHRNLSLDSCDILRGEGLPPAPRWEGDETGLLITY